MNPIQIIQIAGKKFLVDYRYPLLESDIPFNRPEEWLTFHATDIDLQTRDGQICHDLPCTHRIRARISAIEYVDFVVPMEIKKEISCGNSKD